MTETISRFLKAIGYPEGDVASSLGGVVLKVDGGDMTLAEESGRLVLGCSLGSPDDDALARLAGYAAGRLLKEEATLAWDPRSSELILWQGVSAGAPDAALRRFFEVFAASCDWWRDRAREEDSSARVPEMMIRP